MVTKVQHVNSLGYIVEYIEAENRERRYSDQNLKLLQVETDILYDDAVDVIPCPYTYEESDEPIDYLIPEKSPEEEV